MTGPNSHRRGVMAWMIACLVAVFVATPLLDSFTCRAEVLNGPAASAASATAGTSDVVVVDDHRTGAASSDSAPPGHSDDGGLSTCFHGHCHHAGVAAAIAVANLSHLDVVKDAGVPSLTPVLHSADLAHSKRPPRA